MTGSYQNLLSDAFLRAVFDKEFQAFKGSEQEAALVARLEKWSFKGFQKETSAEAAFLSVFFEDIWGYRPDGKAKSGEGYTCYPKYQIPGAGAGGSTGQADAALGMFDRKDVPPTPQVICEFKDVRANLDGPQKRKGNNRSPVKQCADYLREVMKPLFGNEAIQPTWGIVTDMNEFRLYWRSTMPSQYQRFVIKKKKADEGIPLLPDEGSTAHSSDAVSFQRFLFAKLFHADSLLTTGGSSALRRILEDQRFQEKRIEKAFYLEYKAYREYLVDVLIKVNPNFNGTKGRLVRLAQKLIDRCIFVMFCEDMGEQLSFPPNALSDYLSELSKTPTFEENEQDAWNKLKELFTAMNEGKKFRSRPINRFNGGLFATDGELDGLTIPNEVFCTKMQGENDETLKANRKSLLYFAGTYNFGSADKEDRAITLYTLGRIFEQSITELEYLEAEKEGKSSIAKVTKRKRDGVYYTPEPIVERVVAETLSPRLDEIRKEVGWQFEIEGDEATIAKQIAKPPSDRSEAFKKHAKAVKAFRDRLDDFKVLDPACGSGAFLIHTLDCLLRERRRVQREYALVTGGKGDELFEFKSDDEIRSILSKNIYGVDINPASVEIARLALWLHTAKSDQPLSNLDTNIVTGNSLVGSEVYLFKKDLLSAEEEKKETINPFDYEKAFPDVFAEQRPGGKGFDCVVGNPPYVKIQNFKKVYPETADFLVNATAAGGIPRYQSCQVGSFDLYLPFIERGLELLNTKGRLGYIAPSVWRFNKYAEGLKSMLLAGKNLSRWIDFRSYQVFDDVITYTALQFFTKEPSSHIQIALAPRGILADIPDWSDPEWRVDYKELSKTGPWIFASRTSRQLIARLQGNCTSLANSLVSTDISQGLISGAAKVFVNERLAKDRYESRIREKPEEVAIESDACLPLISAEDIDPYLIAKPTAEIIFPYEEKEKGFQAIPEADFKKRFPLAYKHLKANEVELRSRDSRKMDEDDIWYTFSRTQNLDKQRLPKIVIAGTGQRIEAAIDYKGTFATNDKRVYSVFPTSNDDMAYLTGVLNSEACNFVFKHLARPKDGGYYDIETQFLAPLPIPKASKGDKDKVTEAVKALTQLYAEQRAAISALNKRFDKCDTEQKPIEWLWPSVRSVEDWKKKADPGLSARARSEWANAQHQKQVEEEVAALRDRLRPGAKLEVGRIKGELRLLDQGTVVVDNVFISKEEAALVEISWKNLLRSNLVPEIPDARGLASKLLRLRTTQNKVILDQLTELDAELDDLSTKITKAELKLNNLIDALYKLTDADKALIN